MADEHSTFPEDAPPLAAIRRARLLRRIGLAVLGTIIMLGITGFLGIRMATVTSSGGGYDLSVIYAEVSRSGLATPLAIQVRRAGGFDGEITLGVTSEYLEIFDQNAFSPQPVASTTLGDMVLYRFDPPAGERLTVVMDARLEPAFHLGREAVTAVYQAGAPLVSVRYSTRVMP